MLRKFQACALILLTNTLTLTSCKTPDNSEQASETKFGGDSRILNYEPAVALGLNQEYIPPNEANVLRAYGQKFAELHAAQHRQNQKEHPELNAKMRGMHAKNQGCVDGTIVFNNLGSDWNIGVFNQVNRPMKIVARFSNASGNIQADNEKDLRGLAVKILSPGMPSIEGAPRLGEYDFLMTNAPSHHAKNIVDLMEFTEAMAQGGATKIAYLGRHPFITSKLLAQTSRKVGSLVNESYWGRAPFALGQNKTIKYFAEPVTQRVPRDLSKDKKLLYKKKLAKLIEENDLKAIRILSGHKSELSKFEKRLEDLSKENNSERLKLDLVYQMENSHKTDFNFFVQAQEDSVAEPIEDHFVEWRSQPHLIGKISFPKQIPRNDEACEKMVFNPWNAHPENRPLGNMNRARKVVYGGAEKFRLGR